MTTISWFSAGVSSAVATKLAINRIDRVIYTHINDQHPDTLRFVKDCEIWFKKEIEIIQSPYQDVEAACLSARYINGVAGAACSRLLKRQVRIEWERRHNEPLRYAWGMDYAEKHRCIRLEKTMPMQEHFFPLAEQKISKKQAHEILAASGIKRPKMYDLGYNNNNCLGCVKGGMGYWNKIRVDFPNVFEARSKMERKIGATCLNGIYLDELDPNKGRQSKPIIADCGMFCESMRI